jgi:hypothetical protein
MCAKVFKLEEQAEAEVKYSNFLRETQAYVADQVRVFRSEAISLAMLRAWKKWDEDQPVGTVLKFTDQMFLECADKNVRKLMEVILSMEEFAGDLS